MITKAIIGRVLKGHPMTRRERLQLERTSTDAARLVPFSIFVLVPFMELLLPIALKIFPNMLPSTFQNQGTIDNAMKSKMETREKYSVLMQDALLDIALAKKKQVKAANESTTSTKEVTHHTMYLRIILFGDQRCPNIHIALCVL